MYSEQVINEFLKRKLDSWEWIKDILKDDLIKQIHEYAGGHFFKSVPYTHQLACFLIGIHKKTFLFYLEQGLGKTALILNILSYLKNKGEIKRVLVLVPYNITVQSWSIEVEKHSNLKYLPVLGTTDTKWKMLSVCDNYDLIGMTYPGLTALIPYKKIKKKTWSDVVFDDNVLDKFLSNFDAVVYDEIHSLKSYKATTVITGIAKRISAKCQYVYGLTGTPTGRDLQDLWMQFYLIDKGVTFSNTISFFRQAFFQQKRNYWGGYVYTLKKDKKALLHEFMQNSSIRYEEKDVFDMPEKVSLKRYLTIGKQQSKFYEEALQGFIKAKGDVQKLENAFIRLRQILSGFIYIKEKEDQEEIVIVFDENPKLEALMELITGSGDDKVVVFNMFTKSGDIICDRLTKEKIKHERLYGETENPFEGLQNFINDSQCKVYVVNTKCGSTSLNLQVAKYSIFFETPTSPIDRLQCEKRTFRGGIKHRLFEYDFIISNSIDEKMLQYVKEGKNLYKEIINNSEILVKP